MKKKLLKSGNSLVMVMPPTYLELIGVDKNDYKNYTFDVSVDTAQKHILIKPYTAAIDEVMDDLEA